MNKREFVAGGVAAVVAVPARAVDTGALRAPLQGLLTRMQRLPDLVARPGADVFAAYVGERFAVVGGAGSGERLTLRAIERVARCAATEQFNVVFETADAPVAGDGVRLLAHATGQRIALHLERGPLGYAARFNLLA